MSARRFTILAVFLGFLLAGRDVRAAEPATTGDQVLIQAGFDPAEKQWATRLDGKTRSLLEYEDGLLKFYPGPGTDGKGRSNWHGREVSRALTLYGDYTIELRLAWDAKTLRGACRALIAPRSNRAAPLTALFHLNRLAIEVKDTAQCIGWREGLPEAGQGVLRFERRGPLLRVLWEGSLLAELTDEAPATVDAFAAQFINLPQTLRQAWVGVSAFTVSVPQPDVPLAETPFPGRDEARARLSGLANETQAWLKTLRDRAYKRDTTLDVLGFDLAAIRDRKEQAEMAGRVTAFGDRARVAERLRAAVAAVNRRVGGAVQFAERIPADALARVEADVESVRRELAAALEPLDAEEKALRRALADRRPSGPADGRNLGEWARDTFHLYWFNHYGNDPPGYEDALRYMGEMGSSVLQEWSYRGDRRHGAWEDYVADGRRRLNLIGREGMKMFILAGQEIPIHPHPDNRQKALENVERYIAAFGDHPAFAGFEFDEVHYGNCWCRLCLPLFHDYLKKRFTREALLELGVLREKQEAEPETESLARQLDTILDDPPVADSAPREKKREKAETVEQLGGPEPDERSANPALYTLRLEWRARVFEETAKAVFDRARSLKPDILMHTLLSPANFADFTHRDWGGPFAAPLYRMAALSDIIAIDPYWNGVPEEAYWCDLMRAHAKGPALLTVGTHYDARTPDSLERDLSIPFAHADGLYVFDWVSCFKQPPYTLGAAYQELWNPSGKWDRVWSVATKAKRLAPYLVRTEPPRMLAMAHSMRSQALERHRGDLAGADPGAGALALPGLYNMRQMGLYSLFRQARLQPDPVYAEGLTPAQLDRYPLLFLQNTVSLTPEEEELIRSWVRNGGRLLATASTTRQDRWGRDRDDYGLADVFGAHYAGTRTADRETLGTTPETLYSGAVDQVRPGSGQVVLAWSNGAPAVIENTFGKGRCVFVTARDLGLNYTGENAGPERRAFNVYKTYSPGVVEFVRGLVTRELAAANRPLPFTARNVPGEVEIAVRVQPGSGRRVVHLLNYGYRTPVAGAIVAVPAGDAARVFYAADGQAVDGRRQDGRLEFTVRNFDVHEAIVVEEGTK